MKKFSLKKVTAAVSTAAMIASMGTMAFANKTSALALTIGEPVAGDNGVYTYTITYTGDVTNDNGVSMLAYGVKGDGDTAGVTGSIAEKTQYATGMRILGVEQNSKDATKEFKLVLTTKADGTNGYYVQAGKPVVVAVNGNGEVGYGYIKTYATADAIADILGDVVTEGKLNLEASTAENGTDDKVKTAAKGKVLDYLGGIFGSDNVTVSDDSLTVTRDSGVSVSYTATVKAGKYTVSDTSYTVSDTSYNVASDLTVQGTVTVPYTVLEASEITNSGVTMTENDLSDAADAKAKVKELLAGKTDVKVTLKNGDVTDEVTLNFAEGGNAIVDDITAEPTTAENGSDKVYTVPVTVKAGTTGAKGIVKVGETGKTVDVKVTVTAKEVINGINGFTLGTTATISDKSQWNAEGIAGAALAQLAAPNGVAVSVNDVAVDNVKVQLQDLTLTTTLNPATITDDTTSVDVTIKATALTGSSLVDTHCIDPNGVELGTVTVTFQAYKLGDVTGDGNINAEDAVAVMKYATGVDKSLTETQLLAANVTKGDSNINASDAVEIMKYATGVIKKFPIEE